MIVAGTTYFNVATRDYPRHHHFVLSNPATAPDTVITVNYTSVKGQETAEDLICQLTNQDVPIITLPSYVAFDYYCVTKLVNLDAALAAGAIQLGATLLSAPLAKVRAAFMVSVHTPVRWRTILQNNP